MRAAALGTLLQARDTQLARQVWAAIGPAPHHLEPGVRHAALALHHVDQVVDRLDPSVLPSEAQRMVRSRLRTFVAGRLCAEHALRQLGLDPGWLNRDMLGAPCWPDGIVGSIAHCDGLACAAAMPATSAGGLGLDSERRVDRQALLDIRRTCCTPGENAHLFGAENDALIATLVFSAKEAYYKAISARVGRFVEFTEVEVQRVDEWGRYIDLRPISDHLRAQVRAARVAFVVVGDFVHTAVSLPPYS